ncbi:peroxiredoxin family protein [Streptomyces violascens]|uniref:peroxiredoxin family protein n=1 Tax=Streptomyces violascens TaxID=67381 RepID=UPI00367C7EBB
MSWPWIALVLTQGMVLIVLGLIVLGVLRRIGPALETLEAGLPPQRSHGTPSLSEGSPVPAFNAVTADGATVTSRDLWTGPTVMLFVSPHCRPCHTLLTELKGTPRPLEDTALVVIAPDPAHTTDNASIDARILADPDRHISYALGVTATPAAMAIGPNGQVAAPLRTVNTLRQLQALADAQPPQAPVASSRPQEARHE